MESGRPAIRLPSAPRAVPRGESGALPCTWRTTGARGTWRIGWHSDGCTDGGLLEAPVALTEVTLTPGIFADDFEAGDVCDWSTGVDTPPRP